MSLDGHEVEWERGGEGWNGNTTQADLVRLRERLGSTVNPDGEP